MKLLNQNQLIEGIKTLNLSVDLRKLDVITASRVAGHMSILFSAPMLARESMMTKYSMTLSPITWTRRSWAHSLNL